MRQRGDPAAPPQKALAPRSRLADGVTKPAWPNAHLTDPKIWRERPKVELRDSSHAPCSPSRGAWARQRRSLTGAPKLLDSAARECVFVQACRGVSEASERSQLESTRIDSGGMQGRLLPNLRTGGKAMRGYREATRPTVIHRCRMCGVTVDDVDSNKVIVSLYGVAHYGLDSGRTACGKD